MEDIDTEQLDCMMDYIYDSGKSWNTILAEEKLELDPSQESKYHKYIAEEIFRNLELLNDDDLNVWHELKKSILLSFLKNPPLTTTYLANRLIKAQLHPYSEELKEWVELNPEYAYLILEQYFPDAKDEFFTFAILKILTPRQRVDIYNRYKDVCKIRT